MSAGALLSSASLLRRVIRITMVTTTSMIPMDMGRETTAMMAKMGTAMVARMIIAMATEEKTETVMAAKMNMVMAMEGRTTKNTKQMVTTASTNHPSTPASTGTETLP